MLDGKYETKVQLVNKYTGSVIPEDEPVFVLRARDIHATDAMKAYASFCQNTKQALAVKERITEFKKWQRKNLDKLKEPDC